MKFVSWNIQQGGGSRVDRIVAQLTEWAPDIVGLSEFRGSASSQEIAGALREMGLSHQVATTNPDNRNQNGLLMASRWEMEPQPCSGVLSETRRWIHAKVGSLDVILMHVPNRDEGKCHGMERVKYKMHDAVIESFDRLKDRPALAFGDTNSGRRGLDEASAFFNKREDHWFERIESTGWVDVWRSRNPDGREYTWHTRSGADAGFRLDQVFATRSIESRITHIRHDWGGGGRAARLSDHAAIVFEGSNHL